MAVIKFKTLGATSSGGSFGPGDIMRCDDAMAKHLVEEAQCAEYLDAAPGQVEDAAEKSPRRARKAAKE